MLQAIIFDFNGVIISDEEYHKESWRRFTKKLGYDLSEAELNENVFGHRETDVFRHLLGKEIDEGEVEKLSRQRNEIVYDLQGKFIPVAGVVEFVKEVKKANIPLGLATNSRRDYMTRVLKEFNIENYFDVIVTAEDVTIGKPDPQIYIRTAESLKIDPKNILVFEDSQAGISSAKNAEMRIVALTTTHMKEEALARADKIIHDFTEINIEKCVEMFEE